MSDPTFEKLHEDIAKMKRDMIETFGPDALTNPVEVAERRHKAARQALQKELDAARQETAKLKAKERIYAAVEASGINFHSAEDVVSMVSVAETDTDDYVQLKLRQFAAQKPHYVRDMRQPSAMSNQSLAEIFGPKSDSRKAVEFMKKDPTGYRAMKAEARKEGLI